MTVFPPGCDFKRSKLTRDKGRMCRIFYDEDGQELHRVYGPRPTTRTGIEVDQRKDPAAYHREYYRRVRRLRDGRTPRVSSA